MALLLDLLRQRLVDRSRWKCDVPFDSIPLCPPATATEVAAAEEALGVAIPPLLKLIYLEISNGGFGPGYGLFGAPYQSGGYARRQLVEESAAITGVRYDYPDWWLEEKFADNRTIVSEYRFWSKQFAPAWPRSLVPFIYCGCTVYECVDCSAAPYPVFGFDGESLFTCRADPAREMRAIEVTAISAGLETRLETWLLGEKLW